MKEDGDGMENETKLETFEQVQDAIGVLAAEVVRLGEVQQAQGKLIMNIDARIKALTALIDHLHDALTKLAGLPQRPRYVDVN